MPSTRCRDSGTRIPSLAIRLAPSSRVTREWQGEVSLDGLSSVRALRVRLLQLADELLLDPEDDLGEWTLQYTDRAGVLLPVDSFVTIALVQHEAQELRVTAGRALVR